MWRRREGDRARKELYESMRRLLAETFSEDAAGETLEGEVAAIVSRKTDPRTAAKKLLRDLKLGR